MNKLFQAIRHIRPLLAQTVEHDEANGRLSEKVSLALREAGVYKLFLPATLGGSETDPLITAKLMEEIACYNAAAAWSVMVANTSNWFCKFLPAEEAEAICHTEKNTFCAGTFAAPLVATPTEGGYSVTGQTPLCSNVHQAQWIALLSIVMKNSQPVMTNGMPELRGVILKSEDCRILDTWQVLGMKATDSNDVIAENVFVPASRSFILSPVSEINKHYQGKLYRFPLPGILSCCLIVPVALAIATNAIQELKLSATKIPSGSRVMLKEKSAFQRILAEAEGLVRSARAYLHQALSVVWDKIQNDKTIQMEDRAELLLAASNTNSSCTKAVDLAYSAMGTTAIYNQSRMSRYFTDMQVVRQHGFANTNRFETVGQILLGLQPDFLPAML